MGISIGSESEEKGDRKERKRRKSPVESRRERKSKGKFAPYKIFKGFPPMGIVGKS